MTGQSPAQAVTAATRCPYCLAPPGEKCKAWGRYASHGSVEPGEVRRPHKARVTAWLAQLTEEHAAPKDGAAREGEDNG